MVLETSDGIVLNEGHKKKYGGCANKKKCCTRSKRKEIEKAFSEWSRSTKDSVVTEDYTLIYTTSFTQGSKFWKRRKKSFCRDCFYDIIENYCIFHDAEGTVDEWSENKTTHFCLLLRQKESHYKGGSFCWRDFFCETDSNLFCVPLPQHLETSRQEGSSVIFGGSFILF